MAESGCIRIQEAVLAGDDLASFWDKTVGNRQQDVAALGTGNHHVEPVLPQDADQPEQRLFQCFRMQFYDSYSRAQI